MKEKAECNNLEETKAQNGHSSHITNGSTPNESDSSVLDSSGTSSDSPTSSVSPSSAQQDPERLHIARRSKFGRVRKPKVNPCMEYTPIVRGYSSHNRAKQGTPSHSPPSPSHGGETPTSVSTAASEPTQSSQYLVGDLLWVKVGNHPHWPTMVSYDPPNRTLPFEGLEKFMELIDSGRVPHGVPPRKRDDWKVAVEEAVAAMQMTRAQRKLQLTFKYYDPPSKKLKSEHPPKENGVDQEATEKNCLICGASGATLTCTGTCGMSFHLGCIGITQPPDAFLCDECTAATAIGEPIPKHHYNLPPHVCKALLPIYERLSDERLLEPCQRGKAHDGNESLHSVGWVLSAKDRHASLLSIQVVGRLLRCVQCPSAFHPECLPAGSNTLGSSSLVCPRHGSQNTASAINVSWCMVCSEGGKLLCCEGCPAAFHETCLGLQETPEGTFLCPDCQDWKYPKYGDMIWVKLGCYRWWPAQVCAPGDIPLNIQALKHEPIGDFAVRFYGSHDYYWTNRKRVFLFEEGDSGSLNASSKSVARLFQAALEEARQAWEEQRRARELGEKPAPFRMIRVNRVVCPGAAMPSAAVHKRSVCTCTPQDPCRANCLNRLLLYECSRKLCPAGPACENQRFQKRTYAETALVRTPGRGWGLLTSQALAAGDFVMEYVGELIDDKECERRLKELHTDNIQNFYFLTLAKDRIIDAGPMGNMSRFINHSCQPNCVTQKWTVNGDTRVGIFAIRDIPEG
ncbi:hypothetical protein HPB51_014012 [Rhipicephalus microplus]|uniref:Uncharacterized protein n=1 Tax=Rhipicephalus microplus TaxID=6941 RepID=A0A9J6DAF4_RHIMP|nr:hypothetical protein HPB51_014012 [Rhipicephalus microplus]